MSRVRERQAAAKQFVERRRGPAKDAPLQPGDIVYRKGQACTVVVVSHDTCPPHVVVRTQAGNEVGTEQAHLEREPPSSPVRRAPLTAPAPSSSATASAPRQRAPEDNIGEEPAPWGVPQPPAAAISDRHTALARMRQRRAERAAEDARDRDHTLAELLAEDADEAPREPSSSSPQRPRRREPPAPASPGTLAPSPPPPDASRTLPRPSRNLRSPVHCSAAGLEEGASSPTAAVSSRPKAPAQSLHEASPLSEQDPIVDSLSPKAAALFQNAGKRVALMAGGEETTHATNDEQQSLKEVNSEQQSLKKAVEEDAIQRPLEGEEKTSQKEEASVSATKEVEEEVTSMKVVEKAKALNEKLDANTRIQANVGLAESAAEFSQETVQVEAEELVGLETANSGLEPMPQETIAVLGDLREEISWLAKGCDSVEEKVARLKAAGHSEAVNQEIERSVTALANAEVAESSADVSEEKSQVGAGECTASETAKSIHSTLLADLRKEIACQAKGCDSGEIWTVGDPVSSAVSTQDGEDSSNHTGEEQGESLDLTGRAAREELADEFAEELLEAATFQLAEEETNAEAAEEAEEAEQVESESFCDESFGEESKEALAETEPDVLRIETDDDEQSCASDGCSGSTPGTSPRGMTAEEEATLWELAQQDIGRLLLGPCILPTVTEENAEDVALLVSPRGIAIEKAEDIHLELEGMDEDDVDQDIAPLQAPRVQSRHLEQRSEELVSSQPDDSPSLQEIGRSDSLNCAACPAHVHEELLTDSHTQSLSQDVSALAGAVEGADGSACQVAEQSGMCLRGISQDDLVNDVRIALERLSLEFLEHDSPSCRACQASPWTSLEDDPSFGVESQIGGDAGGTGGTLMTVENWRAQPFHADQNGAMEEVFRHKPQSLVSDGSLEQEARLCAVAADAEGSSRPLVHEDHTPVAAISQPPVDVLLCLDASFGMHAPLDLASSPVASWDEDSWDAFGQHVRARIDPCRLDTLGVQMLNAIGVAFRGLAVEIHFCGEDDSEAIRPCPFDADSLGRQWKRKLLRGEKLWSRVADDVERLRASGLKSVVVVAGGDDDLRSQERCAQAYQAVGRLALAELPVHVVTLSAPHATHAGSSIAAATGGTCTALDFQIDTAPGVTIDNELRALSRSLRSLSKPELPTAPVSHGELRDAACTIQRATRNRQERAKRREELERHAVARISAAYAQWRFRRSIDAAVIEGRRARKRAPVEAALQRRKDTQYQVDADAAARRIQAEWRARRMRLWCQRIDRAARRLQRYVRRRWLRHRLERQVPIEVENLKVLRRRRANAPPLPPSQWPLQGVAHAAGSAACPKDVPACHNPRGSSALLACPPPMKKPSRPRTHGAPQASQLLDDSGTPPLGASLASPRDRGCMGDATANMWRAGSAQTSAPSYRNARGFAATSGTCPPAAPSFKKVFKAPVGGTLPRLGGGGGEVFAASQRALCSPRRKLDTMM